MAKTEQILELDYRVGENQETIQKVLRQIKPLSKYPAGQEVPLSKIEKALLVITKKYTVDVLFVLYNRENKDKPIYTLKVRPEGQKDYYVYGICLYELFAKTVISIYSKVKNKEIKTRED